MRENQPGQARTMRHEYMPAATRLNSVRTACSFPQLTNNARASSESRSRPGDINRWFVGMMPMNVKGTTAPIRNAASSHAPPLPASQREAPARKLATASGACNHVARL